MTACGGEIATVVPPVRFRNWCDFAIVQLMPLDRKFSSGFFSGHHVLQEENGSDLVMHTNNNSS